MLRVGFRLCVEGQCAQANLGGVEAAAHVSALAVRVRVVKDLYAVGGGKKARLQVSVSAA